MKPEDPLIDVVTFLLTQGKLSPMSFMRSPQIDNTGLPTVTDTLTWALSCGAIFIKAVYTEG